MHKNKNALLHSLDNTKRIPQGNVPEPVILNVYINLLLQALLTDNQVAHADDITLIASDTSLELTCEAIQLLQQQVYK